MNKIEQAKELTKLLANYSPKNVMAYFINEYKEKLAFASSLGAEDQVITHLLNDITKDVNIFTLDTGRLFPETYKLIEKTNRRYKIKMKVFFPDYKKVQKMVAEKGVYSFYNSIEDRKECCAIRKLEPLSRAFKGLDVWICGLRRDQSVTRTDNQLVEWDESNQLIKVNPIIDWTEEDVWKFIRENNIPYNDLHDKGFRSIGCQPCTRAVAEGEDLRSGRWWWEQPDKKECGLHNSPANK